MAPLPPNLRACGEDCRRLKRQASLFHIMETNEYQDYWSRRTSLVQRAGAISKMPHVPMTPNPHDDSITKRRWEVSLSIWRKAWKRFLAEAMSRERRHVRFDNLILNCAGGNVPHPVGSRLQATAEATVFNCRHEFDECLRPPFEAVGEAEEPSWVLSLDSISIEG